MARRLLAVSLACLFSLTAPPAEGADHRHGHDHGHDHDCPSPERASGRAEPRPLTATEFAQMNAALRNHPGPVPPTVTVPLWVHVLTDGHTGAPDAAVREQVNVLNRAYSGGYGGADTGVRFALRGITRTENRDWFRNPLGMEDPMKTSLRRGGSETLNLYVSQLSELVLGYATYPNWYAGNPSQDGVVIDWRTLPGGALRNFNFGFTGVHEIGHWLGLVHTFENGCSEPGDSVDDTPFQATPTEGCPDRRDSCAAAGEDPIHNFMDYAHDRCMNQFTAGQGLRMRQAWVTYRGGVAGIQTRSSMVSGLLGTQAGQAPIAPPRPYTGMAASLFLPRGRG